MARSIAKASMMLLTVLLFAGNIEAQPVISAEMFSAQSGASFEERLAGANAGPLPQDLTQLESILLADGNNSTFDFKAITPELQLFSNNRYIQLPTDSIDAPGFDAFFSEKATDVWHVDFVDASIPDVFLYRRITTDSLAWLGNGVWQDSNGDGVADPVVSIFSPGKLQAPLPLQLNDTWTTDFTHISVVNTPVGVIEVAGTVENHDIKVDGYGTLVTNEGSFPCLRVRINQVIISPDGTRQELGGWSFVTAELVQLGVFYPELIPDAPSASTFDFQSPHSISFFAPSDDGMSTAIEPDNLPNATFVLGQSYPNPFSKETSIPFQLDEAGQVRLRVYNALGQLVDEPINNFLPAGEHTYQWQANSNPAGLYFYRLEMNGVPQQQIMTLVK